MKKVGIGTRVINCLVDTTLIFLLSYILFQVWKFYVFYYKYPYYPFWYFFTIVLVIYYLLFESLFARTPGKWLSYSKVVDKKGLKPKFLSIILRTFTRLIIIDCFFFPFMEKMLHDFTSNTEVVEV